DKYIGTYKDAVYGTLKVTREKEKLVASLGPPLISDLEHWHYDTFRGTPRDRALEKVFVTFALNSRGEVQELKLTGAPGAGDLVLERAEEADTGAAITLSEDELKKFAGKYALETPPVELSIELVGGKLKAVVPGQPVYTLVPVKPSRFRIDGAPAGYF